jgi:hypothetical protein
MRAHWVVAAAVLSQSWACSSMQSVPVEFIPETKPTFVQLTGQHGLHVGLEHPRLSGDTIYGMSGGNTEAAYPLRQIGSITTRRFSRARTALLIGGGVMLAGMATFFIALQGNSEPMYTCGIENPIDDVDREKCGA